MIFENSFSQFCETGIIFTHLKLWIASARHNFKWLKIPIVDFCRLNNLPYQTQDSSIIGLPAKIAPCEAVSENWNCIILGRKMANPTTAPLCSQQQKIQLLCLDLMVQTCWSHKATFFILLLLLSFLVRDYRDSLQVIYFKPRHNGP